MSSIAAIFPFRVRRLLAATTPAIPSVEATQFLERSPNAIVIADLADTDLALSYVNRAFETMTGYSRSEALGRNCRYLQGTDVQQPGLADIHAALALGEPVTVTLRNYRKDGRLFWNELRLVPLNDDSEKPTHYMGVMRDVTALKEMQERLEFAATTDRLTGCLNRYAFTDRISTLAAPARKVMVVKVDVVGFSIVNTGYGYDAGDSLLTQIASRLRRVGADVVGRIGSNEFAVGFCIDGDDGHSQLSKVSGVLAPRYNLPGLEAAPVDAQVAIGFVVGRGGEDGNTLLRRAGTALAQSKSSALREPREFDRGAAADAERRLRLTSEILQGVANREFLYHYQPKVDLRTGAIVGAEALLRWQHPTSGLLYPDSFLELAEQTGLIIDISTTFFSDVAAFARALNQGRETPLNIAFNLSTTAFRQRDIVERAKLIARDIDPNWLTLELTEGMMAESSDELIDIFHQLRDVGFGLSIDDFGTGYSSLRYLESFPISEIKIDRSFINGMIAQPPKRFIVDAVIKIGWALNASVIAEGVETETEAELLRELGCTQAQGYLFGRPMPAADFLAMMGMAGGSGQ